VNNYSYLLIIFFLLLSAFFSGSETAFFSLSKIQLKKLKKNKSKSYKRIYHLLKKPGQLLILILLGNTIVNVAASSTAAIIALNIGKTFFNDSAGFLPLFFEILIMTTLLLIFGEITPKLFAFSAPEKVAEFSSFFLEILYYLLWPIIKILDLLSSIFSKRKVKENYQDFTPEDLKNLINSKSTKTPFKDKEKKIITSIFRFTTTLSKEIMVPRVDIIAVEASEGLNKLKKCIVQFGYSKIPIYKTNIDNIIGFVYAKDVILQPNKKSINSLLRPAFFITKNVKIQNLLNQFKTKKIQIAIVVDEYGGTSGLITLEDILEELVGEIMDEYDNEKPMISRESENEYLINGMFSIAELNHEFSLKIDEDKFDNLAEFLYDHFNEVPKKNDSFLFGENVKFTITDIKNQRINYVKMEFIKKG